jgi:hypothetical protein
MFLAVVSYILGVSMETFIPRRGLLRYLNPVTQFTLIYCYILRYSTGSVQQERKCLHYNHGKRLCQLCLRYRSSCSPAVSEPCLFSWNLLIFAKDCTTISRPMLSSQCSYSFLLNFLGMRIVVKVPTNADKVLSYGIGGMMRGVSTIEFVIEPGVYIPLPGILLYPSKMLYPGVLPLLSMFDALYEGGMAARKKLRVFSMVLAA